MTAKPYILTTSQLARRLGTSAKALRLYEQRGLLRPSRSSKGWRLYDIHDVDKATRIVRLRKLGLTLAEIQTISGKNSVDLEAALAVHCNSLATRISELQACISEVHQFQQELGRDHSTNRSASETIKNKPALPSLRLSLPWPWDGEQFNIPVPGRINFITGPLASGKTQLAKAIADELDNGEFIGLDRLDRSQTDAHLCACKVRNTLAQLQAHGAITNEALTTLVKLFDAKTESVLVIDLIEQDLEQTTQEALMHYLRDRPNDAAPIFIMTRSSTILNMNKIKKGERIIFCPANHSLPMIVEPVSGSIGYEAMNSCLATPIVRARSAGVVARIDAAVASLPTS